MLSRRMMMLPCSSSSSSSSRRAFLLSFREPRRLSTVSSLVNERPRLQALREQLQSDEGKPLLTTTITSKKQPATTLPWNHRVDNDDTVYGSSSPEPQQQRSVQELVQQLQHVPLPENVLTDSFQRKHSYLRLSLVERCNLRCRYCMPPEGVPLQDETQLLSRNELVTLTSLFVKHGVDKVRLTGGEPLLRKDLVDIVHELSLLNISQIGMTTNGITLQRHLPQLVEAGLTHVNISLDTLKPNVFLDLTRRHGLEHVLQSIESAKQLLPQPGRVKINCVVMKDINDSELLEFVTLGKKYNVDVRFIEYMPFSQNGWNQNRFVSYKDMLQRVSCDSFQRLQDGPNDTTKWYSSSSSSDGSTSRVGFITSMSQHFCGTCNRLRLTADGKLKTCLFGATEISLRDVLRGGGGSNNEEVLEKIIHYALSQKAYSLGGHSSAQAIANNAHDNRPMTLIGG